MTDVKRPNMGPAGLHAHAKRDFYRGFQTKNNVKGAGGGARGVDYQDFEAENRDKDANTPKAGQQQQAASTRKKSTAEHKQEQLQGGAVPENVIAEMIAAQQQQKVEGTVNQVSERDQDPRKKKPPPQQQNEEPQQDEQQPPQDQETWQAPAPAANVDVMPANDPVHHQAILSSIARMLADPNQERQVFGAFSLTEPDLIKKTLGTPVRVAKHLLVLSSRMLERGDPRPGVVDYVANTFLTLGPEFGRRAFKDFSLNIGIGSIYPLEVRERLIAVNDSFLPTMKVRFTSTKRQLSAKVREMVVLEYPEEMVIKEFAVKGGTRQGYVLAPLKEKGKHGLRFFVPGAYTILLLGLDAMGTELMEEIRVDVAPDATLQAPTAQPGAPGAPGAARRPLKFLDKLKAEREARERGNS